jgi:hypothetical protein
MDLSLEIRNLFDSSDKDYEEVVNLIVSEINSWGLEYLSFYIDESEIVKDRVYEKRRYSKDIIYDVVDITYQYNYKNITLWQFDFPCDYAPPNYSVNIKNFMLKYKNEFKYTTVILGYVDDDTDENLIDDRRKWCNKLYYELKEKFPNLNLKIYED